MQQELTQISTMRPIEIVGVNGAGFESGNPDMVMGRSVALLQDTAEANVWGTWQVAYRDVVLVDQTGVRRSVFNVTTSSLSDLTNYEALKTQLINLANTP